VGDRGRAGNSVPATLWRPPWDEYFMLLAKLAATRSTCLSRPVGCVIVVKKKVVATGYAGSVPGGRHCIDEGRCYKRRIGGHYQSGVYDLCRSVHAEANAVGMAGRHGISVAGGVLYTTFVPCTACAKLLATAEIVEVVYEKAYDTPDGQDLAQPLRTLDEAGIPHRQLVLSAQTVDKAVAAITTATSTRRQLTRTGQPLEQVQPRLLVGEDGSGPNAALPLEGIPPEEFDAPANAGRAGRRPHKRRKKQPEP